jgi:S1-C subfamily serine protease
MTISVKVGDRRKFDQQRSEAPPPAIGPRIDLGMHQIEEWDISEMGLTVTQLTPAIARRLRFAENQGGLLVTEVDGKGPAVSSIRVGEVVDAINGMPVRTVDELDDVLSLANSTRGLEVHVLPLDGSQQTARTVLMRLRTP